MERDVLIIGGLLVLATVFLSLLHKTMARPEARRRRTDQVPLTSSERKVFAQAKALFANKQIVPAAKLLESINRHREAIDMLEQGGYIDEAATMLLRMQRPNRAGVMYARHAYWAKAGECFAKANMKLEVARCAREEGDFAKAAHNFLVTEHYTEAAECFLSLKDYRSAAKNYAKSGYDRRASDLYLNCFAQYSVEQLKPFSDDELQFFIDQLSLGRGADPFAKVLEEHGRLADAVFNLVRYGHVEDAARHMKNSAYDFSEKLNELVTGHDYAIEYLLSVYERNEHFSASGKLLEGVGDFERAIDAYAKAGLKDAELRCKDILTAIKKAGDEDLQAFYEVGSGDDTHKIVRPAENKLESKTHHYAELAANVHLFMGLEESEKLSILDLGHEIKFAPGASIAKRNGSVDGLMIVVEGQVKVDADQRNPGVLESRTELYPGETFGEGWVFSDEAIDASFSAKTAVTLLCLPKEALLGYMSKSSTSARQLYKNALNQWRFMVITNRNNSLKKKVS